ncbi:MAG: protein translocase subunit SecD, partial [Planctomycetes bacterium]|nr:protein translocase subunit SecD [Planctomycetota bacterium]
GDYGQNRVLIQVPKATRAEVERLRDRLTRMGLLEFKLAMTPGGEKFATEYQRAREGKPVQGYKKMWVDNDKSNQFYLVETREARITGKRLPQVDFTRDQLGRPAIGFRLDTRGSKKFAMVTEKYKNWCLAIVLDGVLKSAPVIEERISTSGIIRGHFTEQEVEELLRVLRAGSLPVDLTLLQESTVGPELGHDSIVKGLRAIALAGFLILLFIGFYYLACGAVADGALILNLVFLAGVLGLLGAALTLPGLAGILLTVGMAVDANVLIFERIREESAAGKSVHVALRNGYDKVYTTIIDANVTTLLTAIILYVVGTGPVRGFAITLSAGIVLSMFTALFVTRLTLETFVDRGWLKKFRMFSIIGQPETSYSSWRRGAYVMSGIVLVVGMVGFFTRGSALFDVDFTGGSLVHLSFDKPVNLATVRQKLIDGGFANPDVQAIRTPGANGQKTSEFRVRIKGIGPERLERELLPRVRKQLKDAGLLREKGVSLGQDGTVLNVDKLSKKVGEMELRGALAREEENPLQLEDFGAIVPSGGAKGKRFRIVLDKFPPMSDHIAVWSQMAAVLRRASLLRTPCKVEVGEITGNEEGGQAAATVTTDRPVQWEVLAVTFLRRDFPSVTIEHREDAAKEFRLTGSREKLESLKKQMPDKPLRMPVLQIDGTSVTGELEVDPDGGEKAFTEEDLRAFAEQEGLTEIQIIGEDIKANTYTLHVSKKQVKVKFADIFSGMGAKSFKIDFEEPSAAKNSEGQIPVGMSISRPTVGADWEGISLPLIEYYLGKAGFSGKADEMIVEDFAAGVKTRNVTLMLPANKLETAKNLIQKAFEQTQPVRQTVRIGSVVAEEMQGRALLAVICAAIVIVFYVAVRFHAVRYGVAAVIALIHDVMITAGLIALANWTGVLGDIKINLEMLAAFLTILGYSLNDTIVVFDRIRENTIEAGHRKLSGEVIDLSINQVLSRTILTSATTLVAVVVLYFLGGTVLQGLAFTLIIGVLVGTYSSIFIASPVLLDWEEIVTGVRLFFRTIFLPIRLPFIILGKIRG